MPKNNNITINKLRTNKIGKITENVIEVYKNNTQQLTIKDIYKLKRKLILDASLKNKHVEVQLIKVLSGQWLTFTSEERMNDYFDSKVKDPSKFYEFEKIHFYTQTQN